MKVLICILLLPFTVFSADSYKTWDGTIESYAQGVYSFRTGTLTGNVSIKKVGNEIDLEDCLDHGFTTRNSVCSTLSFVSSGRELYIRDINNKPALLVGTITESEISYESSYLGIRGNIKFLENGNISVLIEDGFNSSDFSYIRTSTELIWE